VILGYEPPGDGDHRLVIGPGARIRTGTVIYGGSTIGCRLETGHSVVIRERTIIGDNFRIWNNSTVDYGCTIGNNVKIHNNVYVAQFTTIKDDVFLAPGVCLANDFHPGCPDSARCMLGPLIERGVQVGANVCLLPRIILGEYSFVGAGSVVTHNIPPRAVAYGNPARVVGSIEDLVCRTGFRDKPFAESMARFENARTLR